ncbi:enoyl-CoA hydratase/isomerase family protein [Brevibacillus choshinensis]|uniref:enoyl-CoA hydratase/isomerase family protein n=1 Tax=Brevibacillus choshinensis TaxID=54911 RepID=UPI002E1C6C13|nr:enoyl-CoA hydratase-related protein [Brevibacillus choshinensis]MED4779928.1 enoyl-CoA hydratase-related protein [Brevibacillus choshinensis]
MSFSQIKVKVVNQIGMIQMNRPDIRNPLTPDLKKELLTALRDLDQNEEAKVIILIGAERAFCAGGDLSSLRDLDAHTGRKRMQKSHELVRTFLQMEKPIIAAVNGAAAGAGFSLALLCDLIISAKSAFFVQSFVKIGAVPDLGVVHFLTNVIGPHRAKELMLLGDRVTAEQAYRLGFVNQVVDDDDLLDQTFAVATKLVKSPSISIGLTKAMVNKNRNDDLEKLLAMESFAQGICFQTSDFREGIQAFFEKRAPVFKGQ